MPLSLHRFALIAALVLFPVYEARAGLREWCFGLFRRTTPQFVVSEIPALTDLMDIQIVGELGAGGAGTAFLAKGKTLEGKEEYLVLKSAHRFNSVAEQSLQTEYETLRKLYPQDVAWMERSDADYLAIRLVPGSTAEPTKPGKDLEKTIKDSPTLLSSNPSSRDTFQDSVLTQLEGIHKKGIIHLDIKPGNLMVTKTPTGYRGTIIDFGVAKAAKEKSQTGTLRYFGPRRWLNRPVSAADDVHALGISFLEMELPGVLTEGPYQYGMAFGPNAVIARLKRLPDDIPKTISPERAMAHVTSAKASVADYRELLKASGDPKSFRETYGKMWLKAFREADDSIKTSLCIELAISPGLGPELLKAIPDGKVRTEVMKRIAEGHGIMAESPESLMGGPGWHGEQRVPVESFLKSPVIRGAPQLSALVPPSLR